MSAETYGLKGAGSGDPRTAVAGREGCARAGLLTSPRKERKVSRNSGVARERNGAGSGDPRHRWSRMVRGRETRAQQWQVVKGALCGARSVRDLAAKGDAKVSRNSGVARGAARRPTV